MKPYGYLFYCILFTTSVSMTTIADSMNGYESAPQDVQAVVNKSYRALDDIASWNDEQLRYALQNRLLNNLKSIAVLRRTIQTTQSKDEKVEAKQLRNELLEDQKALTFIIEELQLVDHKEQLDMDRFFREHPILWQRLEAQLAKDLHMQSGKQLVNNILYFTLMDKYAGR